MIVKHRYLYIVESLKDCQHHEGRYGIPVHLTGSLSESCNCKMKVMFCKIKKETLIDIKMTDGDKTFANR